MSSWWSSFLDIFLWFGMDPSDKQFAQAKALYAEFLASNRKDFKALNGSLANFDLALSNRREGKDGRPHPDLETTLSTYASVLWTRYEEKKSLSDLHKVIELDEEACTLWETIMDPASKPSNHANLFLDLGNAYFNQYRRNLTSSELLEKAIEKYEKLRVETDVQRRRRGLLKLAVAFWTWYEDDEIPKTRQLKTQRLDGAIAYLHQALEADGREILLERPEDVDGDQREILLNLAIVYYARYKDRKDRSDLDAAIGYNRKARKAMTSGNRNYVYCIYDLAEQLFIQYQHEQGPKDKGEVWREQWLNANMEAGKGEKELREARMALEEVLGDEMNSDDVLTSNAQKLLGVVKQHVDGLGKNASRNASSATLAGGSGSSMSSRISSATK
ncbi:hypothetical protein CVT25_001291 [Psilocybe cyanescens]|uniref:Uncharacterized protein n=1 Tax=Psilocybe cyanescens TaxID=93625 RepID=A0A409XMD6_PSICY|nr:hypothetical protein CVT25_001291 [Psilocybe cyanescens]